MKITELVYLIMAIVFFVTSIYLFVVTQTQGTKIKKLEGKIDQNQSLTFSIPKISL